MKNVYLLLSIAGLALFISATGFLRVNAPNHSTSFIYKVTSKAVITRVSYDPDQAPQVEKYIDSCFSPEVVFGDNHKTNKEIRISSSELHYVIKGSPGSLIMTAYKMSNSAASLSRLKSTWEGLKSVIKPD